MTKNITLLKLAERNSFLKIRILYAVINNVQKTVVRAYTNHTHY